MDLNTLLSFQEDLTEEEIWTFLNQLFEANKPTAAGRPSPWRRRSCGSTPTATSWPITPQGCWAVSWPSIHRRTARRQAQWEEEVFAFYERCLHSTDGQIQESAAYTLASRCIGTGKLDRADELLDLLSDTHRAKRELMARLRWKQGRREEAWVLLEQELFDQATVSRVPCCI